MKPAKKEIDIDAVLQNMDWKKMLGPTPQELVDTVTRVLNRIDSDKSASADNTSTSAFDTNRIENH